MMSRAATMLHAVKPFPSALLLVLLLAAPPLVEARAAGATVANLDAQVRSALRQHGFGDNLRLMLRCPKKPES